MATAAGTDAVQIATFRGPPTGTPRWSPDGRHLAFDSRLRGHSDIFVAGSDGSGLRRLTEDTSEDVIPSWSRDGRFGAPHRWTAVGAIGVADPGRGRYAAAGLSTSRPVTSASPPTRRCSTTGAKAPYSVAPCLPATNRGWPPIRSMATGSCAATLLVLVERQPAAASRDRGGVARDVEAVSGPRAGRLAARTVSAPPSISRTTADGSSSAVSINSRTT